MKKKFIIIFYMWRSSSSSSSKSENPFGDIPFFVFYSTVLSRLAYFTSENFLPAYLDIFGPIIPVSLMKDINDAPIDKIFDTSIYTKTIEEESIPTYDFEGKKHIDFKEMARRINASNLSFVNRRDIKVNADPGEKGVELTEMRGGGPNDNYTVAYIAISTSNYSGYYILVDTRMPNCIFVLFRGTYSAKSAGSYSKPSSLVPFDIATNFNEKELEKLLNENQGKMFGVLQGIDKILEDVYHSIIESMVYLSKAYLSASSPGSIKVYTTGHSLGGGLTTLFAVDWMGLTKLPQYQEAPYNIFSKKICCVSLASPRVLSPAYSNYFCQETVDGNILFRRVTNRGDPVPGLPNKSWGVGSEGFQHPCSAKKYADTQRQVISLDCASAQSANAPNLDKPLKCRKTKTSKLSGNLSGNMIAHTAYLYINFFNAIDIGDMIKSGVPSSLKQKTSEITRTDKGETNVRIIVGVGKRIGDSTDLEFKDDFFTLNDLRPKPVDSSDPNAAPTVSTDALMNQDVFNDLIGKMTPMSLDDLNPLSPTELVTAKVDKEKVMPTVEGIVSTTSAAAAAGGKKKRHTRNNKRKTNKNTRNMKIKTNKTARKMKRKSRRKNK